MSKEGAGERNWFLSNMIIKVLAGLNAVVDKVSTIRQCNICQSLMKRF